MGIWKDQRHLSINVRHHLVHVEGWSHSCDFTPLTCELLLPVWSEKPWHRPALCRGCISPDPDCSPLLTTGGANQAALKDSFTLFNVFFTTVLRTLRFLSIIQHHQRCFIKNYPVELVPFKRPRVVTQNNNFISLFFCTII